MLLRLNVWRSLRGLPRDLWILSAATLINRLGMMAIPFLVLYLTRELGWSAPMAGLALGVYGAGSIIAAPISGRLCDRIGGLPIIRASLIGAGIILVMIPFAESFPVVIALVLAWSLVSEGGRPATLALVADLVPNEQRKPAFALIRLAINLGMSVGPAAGGFIAAYSFRSIFLVNAVASLAAGAFLVAVPMKSAAHIRHLDAGSNDARSGAARTSVLGDRRLLVFLFATFLASAVFFQHEGALPLFLVQDLHLSTAFYGMLFTINTLMIVFLEVPLNAATAHWPHRWALAAGSLLFAMGSGLFGLAAGPQMIVLGIVVWTFGEMMLFPQASAYVADIAPPHRRGSYMGAYSLAFSIAFAVAPWAGTTVFAHFGATILWASVFLVGVAATVIMLQVTSEEPAEAAAAA
ncbi:MAG TPA: MFS transporter [Gemmatimonadaceae bacterium]|nr:MFS transporter [Gemmatimonadaceae bacterium]